MFSQKIRYVFLLILFVCLIGELKATSTWFELSPGASPTARQGASMAYDPTTSQMILFGGVNNSGTALSETWNWDGSTWTLLAPGASPTPRSFASMAYDQTTGQLILFGGVNNGGTPLNDTWNWDGSTWTQLIPDGSPGSPPVRSRASMAFDQATGQMILFGGVNGGGTLGDTWNWDGSTWTQLTPATSPSARDGASMTYFYPATAQLILFGGFDGSTYQNDTWSWNGTTWTKKTPATSPPIRSNATMSFDSATGEMILFGGKNGGGVLGDTWNWNGTNWTQLTPSDSPASRANASMAFDPATGQLILFGGLNGSSTTLNDTWNWGVACADTPTWEQLSPLTTPTQRDGAPMEYDAATGQMILFGGFTGSSLLNDTWNWDGTTWTQLIPDSTPGSPPARRWSSMAFDPATGQQLLFGGVMFSTFLNDTWNWDGTTWTQLIPNGSPGSPPGRARTSMAYDPATGQLILFGGGAFTIFGDTWQWTGTNWVLKLPGPAGSPSPRYGASMAFDQATGQLILFGGFDGTSYQNDTWSWNGTTWALIPALTSPSPRSDATMAFDSATGQMILFGGTDNSPSATLDDTWSWDGTTWTLLTPATSPPGRFFASMSFDQATGQLILFGGSGPGRIFNDTWNWGIESLTLIVTPDPTSQSICSGGTTSINLSSNMADTTFSWTVTESGVTGASAGSGTTIAQTLTTTTSAAGTATYTITGTSPGGCQSSPVTVVVTVNPLPVVTATPPSQTICSGSTTSIALSAANAPGTTFSWTVIQNGVTGASSGSGSRINQTLITTTNTSGTATYTIHSTSPSGCQGDPITVVVTVNPIPLLMASPVSQTICSGGTTSIALSSSIPGTTFSWSVMGYGVNGAASGSGSSIVQTITATTNKPGTANYIVTATSPGGCSDSTLTVYVTVLPAPVAKATPRCQTIVSGRRTSIKLSSNMHGTTFSWTVVEHGVKGASAGSGSSIAQTLTTTTYESGTATYKITPTSSQGCEGAPIKVVVKVE